MAAIKERFDKLYFEYINNSRPEELEEQLLGMGHDHFCSCCPRDMPEDVVEDIVQESFTFLFDQPQGKVRNSAYRVLSYELRKRMSLHWKSSRKDKNLQKTLLEHAQTEPANRGIFEEIIQQTIENNWENDVSIFGKALVSAQNAIVTEIAGKHGRKVMKSDVLHAMLWEYIDVLMEESEYSATKTEWMKKRLPCFPATDGRTLTPDEFKTYWDKHLKPVLLEKFRKYFAGRDESPPFGFFLS